MGASNREKTLKNLLTNPLKYDTIRVSRGERRTHEPLLWIVGVARNSKKNAKNPLTNRPNCDTIRAQKEF